MELILNYENDFRRANYIISMLSFRKFLKFVRLSIYTKLVSIMIKKLNTIYNALTELQKLVEGMDSMEAKSEMKDFLIVREKIYNIHLDLEDIDYADDSNVKEACRRNMNLFNEIEINLKKKAYRNQRIKPSPLSNALAEKSMNALLHSKTFFKKNDQAETSC